MNAELQNHAPRQRWLQRAALLLTAVALAACTTMPMVKRTKKPAATATRPPVTAQQPATRALPGEGTLQNLGYEALFPPVSFILLLFFGVDTQ